MPVSLRMGKKAEGLRMQGGDCLRRLELEDRRGRHAGDPSRPRSGRRALGALASTPVRIARSRLGCQRRLSGHATFEYKRYPYPGSQTIPPTSHFLSEIPPRPSGRRRVHSSCMDPGLRSSPQPVVRLIRESFPQPPALDTAISHAILRSVSEGTQPQTLRLHRPGSIVAFGPLDRLSPGYGRAIDAARSQGFGVIQRLAGGRAAVFHEQTIAVSWAVPDPQPRLHIEKRFQDLSSIIAAALRDLSVDARVGEVPGEYCPGANSVNARGKTKLVGVGQRILLHAAHVGGVVVVGESERIRDVLIPVYDALDLEWDPVTAGSVDDEVPGTSWEDVAHAILGRFRESYDLIEDSVPAAVIARAEELQAAHEIPEVTEPRHRSP